MVFPTQIYAENGGHQTIVMYDGLYISKGQCLDKLHKQGDGSWLPTTMLVLTDEKLKWLTIRLIELCEARGVKLI